MTFRSRPFTVGAGTNGEQMGRNRGTRKKPVQMGAVQERREYRPPAPVMREAPTEYPIDLGDGHSLHVSQRIYKGKVVWFAIMQLYDDVSGPVEISRIDTCHSEVHRHHPDREERQVFQVIDPDDEPWNIVDRWFAVSYEKMMMEYAETYRRWVK